MKNCSQYVSQKYISSNSWNSAVKLCGKTLRVHFVIFILLSQFIWKENILEPYTYWNPGWNPKEHLTVDKAGCEKPYGREILFCVESHIFVKAKSLKVSNSLKLQLICFSECFKPFLELRSKLNFMIYWGFTLLHFFVEFL